MHLVGQTHWKKHLWLEMETTLSLDKSCATQSFSPTTFPQRAASRETTKPFWTIPTTQRELWDPTRLPPRMRHKLAYSSTSKRQPEQQCSDQGLLATISSSSTMARPACSDKACKSVGTRVINFLKTRLCDWLIKFILKLK